MMAASPRPGGGKRILAALEHGARPAPKPARASGWTIDGWTVGLGLLLLLMVSVAWMMHEKTITPASFKYHASDSHTVVAPRAVAPAATESEQAAAIVNTASPSADAAPAGATAPDRPDWPALAGTQAAAAPDGPARAASPTHKPIAGLGSGPAVRAPQPATQAAAASARNAAGTGSNAAHAAARDTDVTLLAALVAHANKPTVTVTERSRDVVERKDGDTTQQLLARCQQLGLIEGMLCRSRICADRWDADPACRAPAH